MAEVLGLPQGDLLPAELGRRRQQRQVEAEPARTQEELQFSKAATGCCHLGRHRTRNKSLP